MKLCFPVVQVNGLESEIFPNFRGTPALLLVDSENGECTGIDASSGACGATPILIDAVIYSGGIGRGMFNGLRSRGVRVFNTEAFTVAEALSELSEGRLEEVSDVPCCGGDSHEHGASHEHPHGHDHGGHGGCCGSSGGSGGGSCGCGGH